MSRILKKHIEGGIFYVTSRGDHNENIFQDQEDYAVYSDLLKKYKEQYGFKLYAFVLMPNHLHLLMELKEGLTISQVMHDLSSSYTKYFNGKYGKKGHLFQERYKLVLAEKEKYLLALSAYVDLNPKALNLVSDAADYQYSSYYYLYILGAGKRELNLSEEAREIAQYLKGKTYPDFLKEITANEIALLAEDLSKKQILGSADFLKKVNARMESQREEALSAVREGASGKYRKFVLAGSAVVITMSLVSLGLFALNLRLSTRLKNLSHAKDMELSQRLSDERKIIKKDLDELYRADLVSYQAMSKRLELEKKKVKELQEKVK